MISPVNNTTNNIHFSAGGNSNEQKHAYTKDTLLKNNILTRTRIGFDKLTNAFTVYPAKGLKGSKNANFYEFLTMGTVPYLIGSGTLMSVFLTANKHFRNFSQTPASKLGQKMAMGVLFYGLLKNISKPFVTTPVKWFTGVDTRLPYAKVNYELPEDIYDNDITSIEYHEVFESLEFPRWDLLYGDETKGEKRNWRYDKIAKKLGLGTDLKDSDQEVKPLIKEIVAKTKTAVNISQYLWAACGIGLAFQAPWEKFFNVLNSKISRNLEMPTSKEIWHNNMEELSKPFAQFGRSLWESAKGFFLGNGDTFTSKHGGKMLLGAAVLSSVLGVINASTSANKPSKLDSADIIEKDRKYVVN